VIRSSSWLVGTLGALATTMLLASAAASAREQLSDFSNRLPLTLAGSGPWYQLDLPLDVQVASRQPDLGDLRVFDAAGQPQAYAWLHTGGEREDSEAQADVKWFPLYDTADSAQRSPQVRIRLADNGTVVEVLPTQELEAGEEVLRGWLLDTSGLKAPLTRLNIDWASEREGFQQFSIEASDDLQHWRAWGNGQVARLSFADERIEQHDVDLPGQSARYLRLLWQSPQSAPVLTSAQLTTSRSQRLQVPLLWSEPLAGHTEKPNQYVWELPTGLAVERLRLALDQPNSLAPVDVFGRADAASAWQPLQTGLLYRLIQNGDEASQDELALFGQPVRQIMLQVDDRGGGLGAAAPKLQVAIRPVQLVFLARGKGPFTLAVGSTGLRGAQLPLAVLMPQPGGPPGRASVAEVRPLVAAAPAPVISSSQAWKRMILWAVLLLGVATLAGMAWNLARSRLSRSR